MATVTEVRRSNPRAGFMYVVGVIEIAAGLAVLVAPRVGGFLVAAWLGGIVVNLLTNNAPEYYDIALRDFGLFLAVVALTRLAFAFERARSRRPVSEVDEVARAAIPSRGHAAG